MKQVTDRFHLPVITNNLLTCFLVDNSFYWQYDDKSLIQGFEKVNSSLLICVYIHYTFSY